jgi:hypothetical protein
MIERKKIVQKIGYVRYRKGAKENKIIGTVFRGEYGDFINFDKNFTPQDFAAIPVSDFGYRTISIHLTHDEKATLASTTPKTKTDESLPGLIGWSDGTWTLSDGETPASEELVIRARNY